MKIYIYSYTFNKINLIGCIKLGAFYNVEESNSLPETTVDRIHSSFSVLGTIKSLIEYGKEISEMKDTVR